MKKVIGVIREMSFNEFMGCFAFLTFIVILIVLIINKL